MSYIPRPLMLISMLFLLLATTYNMMTPLFESADEVWHYPVVHHLENNGLRLPVLDPQNPLPWRQQAAQPPLYYILAAMLTAPIDTSDIDEVRRLNPHELGIQYVEESVPNAVIHPPGPRPLEGTVLAVHLARALSTLFGLGTIWITYYLARTLFPNRPWVAWGAATVQAFLPMFVLVSASVSNDALAAFLGNALILLLVLWLRGKIPADWRSYTLVGLVVGAGLLTKLSFALGIVLVALTLAVLDYRARTFPKHILRGGIISGSVTIIIAGWWYWHNWITYGDPTALNVFLDVVGRHDPSLFDLTTELDTLLQSTWSFVGAIYAPLPDFVYMIFTGFALAGVIGAITYGIKRRYWGDFALGITALWILITLVGLIRWSLMTPAMQGRLAFGALGSLAVLLVFGLGVWLPFHWRKYVVGGAGVFFFSVAALAPFTVIRPAFAPPPPLEETSEEPIAVFQAENTEIALLRADVTNDSLQPGEIIYLNLAWRLDRATPRNWSLFIHLVNAEGVIVAQRDLYPEINSMATEDLPTGRTWESQIPILVPDSLYTPTDLTVSIGWYHQPTGERLMMSDGDDTLTVSKLSVPRYVDQEGIPNPLPIQLGESIELIGYDINDLSPQPGDTVDLTLYWQATERIKSDYVVFANVIDPATLAKQADSNAMPVNWTRPTSTWESGEIIEDTHTLTIYDDAESGQYKLEIGMYLQDEEFTRLTITNDGDQVGDFLYLTRILIEPPTNADTINDKSSGSVGMSVAIY